MQITTHCPRCQTTYHLDPGMRGKAMRCPRAECRHVFEVRADGETPTASPPPAAGGPKPLSHQSGTVGELVQVLQAEAVAPAPSAEAEGPAAPPPVRRAPSPAPAPEKPALPRPPKAPPRVRGTPAAPSAPPPAPAPAPAPVAEKTEPQTPLPPPPAEPAPPPAPAAEEEDLDWLRELGLTPEVAPSTEGPPLEEAVAAPAGPVELGPGAWEAPPVRGAEPAADTPTETAPEPEPPRKRKKRRRPLVLALLLALIGGSVWGGVQLIGMRQAGNEAERFERANKLFADKEYRDAAPLFSALARDFPQSTNKSTYVEYVKLSEALEGAYMAAGEFATIKQAYELLMGFAADHGDGPLMTKHRGELHAGLTRLAAELLDLTRKGLDRDLLANFKIAAKAAEKYAGGAGRDFSKDVAEVEAAISAREKRDALLTALRQRLAKRSAAAVREARALVAESGLGGDAEVKGLLEKLPAAHLAALRYTAQRVPAGGEFVSEDTAPTLLVAPALEKVRGKAKSRGRPLLALARGVLYALDPHDGAVRWAARVGGETAPPLWLPPNEVFPASVLLVSADGSTLSLLDGDSGEALWRTPLNAPCVSRPVVVGGRAFVPTASGNSGRLDEIELTGGSLLGYFDLGQPLTAGAALQPGTDLLYVPADSYAVYVLDVTKRAVVAVLYTAHPRGSLIGPPLIVPSPAAGRKPADPQAYLLLRQADGLDAMALRAFVLPPKGPDPLPLLPALRPRGWAWFDAFNDGERVAFVTDAGEFVLGQVGDSGTALRVLPTAQVGTSPATGPRAKAQIAHVEGEEFWVLANGGLRRLREGFFRESGPKLKGPGAELVRLGSPLQPAQVYRDEQGRTVLCLVTRSPDGSTSLATAVDAHSNEVLWQRQLGLVLRGQPVASGPHMIAQDANGSLFIFNATQAGGAKWQAAGRRIAGPAPVEGRVSHLLAGANGKVYAVSVAPRESGAVLSVRKFAPGRDPEPPRDFALQAPLAGAPALAGDALVLPLANGILWRQPLGEGAASAGPNWRSPQADPGAEGHVVALSAEEFLVSDGSRGLMRYHCDGKVWEKRAAGEVSSRIAAAPAVVKRGGETAVLVADSGNVVTLLEGNDLKPQRTWQLPGRISAGPFVRGDIAGCVVDGRRMMLLDPARDAVTPVDFSSEIVGEPQLIGGMLVVADQRGRIVGIDPKTGKETGPGYTVQADASPTAAPLAFGEDRLFVPLTDGTVLLVPRSALVGEK